MWSAAPLPVALGAGVIPAAGAGPRYHVVGVGRHEGSDAPSSAQKQVAKQRQLTGSDVLMALQQRAAEKKKKKYYKDKATRNSIDDAGAGAVVARESSSHSSAAVTVKPLCINPQWALQLQQLETRLHQLPHASLTS